MPRGPYVGVMAVYHLPAVYDGALTSGLLHSLGHVAFMGAGLVYWWHLLWPIRSRPLLGGDGPVFYMSSTKILVAPWSSVSPSRPTASARATAAMTSCWRMTPLDDHHVAGRLMAIEQSLVMGVGAGLPLPPDAREGRSRICLGGAPQRTT